MDPIATCKVNGITQRDKPTNSFHPTLQFHSTHLSILASFSSYCFGSVSRFSLYPFPFQVSPLYATCPVPNSRQTKLAICCRARYFSEKLVETKTELKWLWISDLRLSSETWFQMNANIALNPLDAWKPFSNTLAMSKVRICQSVCNF